jgi:hypothetical protein
LYNDREGPFLRRQAGQAISPSEKGWARFSRLSGALTTHAIVRVAGPDPS